MAKRGSDIIKDWPKESREAAQLVIDARGEPQETTESTLVWYNAGPWKRIVATKAFYPHDFPKQHIDSVESFIDYRVPPDKFSALAQFDGSIIAERTAGEVSARCHDEQANFLAINLMHDIVTGAKTVQQAREYYAKEVLDAARGLPTPYMQGLRFAADGREAADRDVVMLTEQDLERAKRERKAA